MVEPVRSCAMTRAKAPRHTLLRLALSPDGAPYLDLLGRAPGRGVYVACERRLALEALGAKGAPRVFKGKARPLAPDEAMRHVEDAVRRLDDRQLELLGIGRRAGKLELGMDAVLRVLESERQPGTGPTVVAIARDASDRTRSRVEQASERCSHEVRVVPLANDKVAIGASLGRDEVAVVAMKPSTLAQRLASEADRRAGLSGEGSSMNSGEVK